jgi:hypothetical protein
VPSTRYLQKRGVVVDHLPDCGFAGVLMKPYALDDLGRMLARTLSAR